MDAFKYRVRTAVSAFMARYGIEDSGIIKINVVETGEQSNAFQGEYVALPEASISIAHKPVSMEAGGMMPGKVGSDKKRIIIH